MSKLTDAVRDFVRMFDQQGVTYAVLGGLAARAHGVPRPTYDVDFTIGVDRTSLPRLFDLAEEMGYTVPAAYRSGWVDNVGEMPFVKFGVSIGDRAVDIDVFLAESGYLTVVLDRRVAAIADDGTLICVVTPEDLIVLKTLSNRPRDAIDIQDVLFMQGELDRDYMRDWADKLGVLTQLNEALAKYDADSEV